MHKTSCSFAAKPRDYGARSASPALAAQAHRSQRISPPDAVRWDGNPTGVGSRETIAPATSHLLPVPRRPHLPLRSSGRRSRRKRADQGGPAARWQDGPLRPGQGRRELPLIGRFSLWCATLEPSYRHSVGCRTALNQWVQGSSRWRLTASGADAIDCRSSPALRYPWGRHGGHSVGAGSAGSLRVGTACDGPLIVRPEPGGVAGRRRQQHPGAAAEARIPQRPPYGSRPAAGSAPWCPDQ